MAFKTLVMGHYIIQKKWLLHTFGGMEWWGINREDKEVQAAWQPAPIGIRTSFITAYMQLLRLRRIDRLHEFRVIDYRKEYLYNYKEIKKTEAHFYLDFNFTIKKQIYLSRRDEPCLYEDWFFIFFTYIKRTYYKP